MLALLLVAVSLGLSNFAASVGLGASGVDRRTRLRVGLVFGFFETVMPIIGLLAGRGAAGALGHATRWLGAALLIATGVYGLVQALRSACDAASTGTPSSGPPVSLRRVSRRGSGRCWSPAWRSASTTWRSASPWARCTSACR